MWGALRAVPRRRARRHHGGGALERARRAGAVGADVTTRRCRPRDASTPRKSSPRRVPTRNSCRCSSPITRSGRCSRALVGACGARAGRDRARRRVRRPVTRRSTSARSTPTCARSPRTSSAGRRVRARCSCARAAARSVPRRRRRNGPARRHRRRSRLGRLRRGVRSGRSPGGEVAAQGALIAARRGRHGASCRASSGSGRSMRRARCRTCCASASKGVEAEPILLALDQHGVAVHSGLVVLVGDARAVAGAGGDGRRRRPFAAGLGRLVEHDRRRRAIRGSVPGNRRTTQGLRAP